MTPGRSAAAGRDAETDGSLVEGCEEAAACAVLESCDEAGRQQHERAHGSRLRPRRLRPHPHPQPQRQQRQRKVQEGANLRGTRHSQPSLTAVREIIHRINSEHPVKQVGELKRCICQTSFSSDKWVSTNAACTSV